MTGPASRARRLTLGWLVQGGDGGVEIAQHDPRIDAAIEEVQEGTPDTEAAHLQIWESTGE